MTYSNRWTDFRDYILGMTKEIWEERGLPRCTCITPRISRFGRRWG